MRAIEARIGQQLLNQRFKLANVAVKRLRLCFRQVLAHFQTIAQAHQRRAQLVRDPVDQLFLAGDKGIDVIGHLVKGHPQTFKAGTAVEVNTLCKMPLAKTLRGGFEFQHVLPVRAHPDKNRKRE